MYIFGPSQPCLRLTKNILILRLTLPALSSLMSPFSVIMEANTNLPLLAEIRAIIWDYIRPENCVYEHGKGIASKLRLLYINSTIRAERTPIPTPRLTVDISKRNPHVSSLLYQAEHRSLDVSDATWDMLYHASRMFPNVQTVLLYYTMTQAVREAEVSRYIDR
jgi:hypothetical protein